MNMYIPVSPSFAERLGFEGSKLFGDVCVKCITKVSSRGILIRHRTNYQLTSDKNKISLKSM